MREATISFRIMHEELDPEEISRVLQIKPNILHRRGEQNISKSGRPYAPFSAGLWSIRSPLEKEPNLTKHFDYMLEVLEPNVAALTEFQKKQYRMDFFVGIFDLGSNDGFVLEAQYLRRISALGLDVVFDIYCSGRAAVANV